MMRTDTSPEALALVGDARRREAIQAGAPLPELLAFTQLPVSLVRTTPAPLILKFDPPPGKRPRSGRC